MHLFIATLALLGFVAVAQAQDRRLSALAAPTSAVNSAHGEYGAPHGGIEHASAARGGFSGSFSARQTVRNLGY